MSLNLQKIIREKHAAKLNQAEEAARAQQPATTVGGTRMKPNALDVAREQNRGALNLQALRNQGAKTSAPLGGGGDGGDGGALANAHGKYLSNQDKNKTALDIQKLAGEQKSAENAWTHKVDAENIVTKRAAALGGDRGVDPKQLTQIRNDVFQGLGLSGGGGSDPQNDVAPSPARIDLRNMSTQQTPQRQVPPGTTPVATYEDLLPTTDLLAPNHRDQPQNNNQHPIAADYRPGQQTVNYIRSPTQMIYPESTQAGQNSDLLSFAQDALKKGADPNEVLARAKESGMSPEDIKKLGL